jgi:hypothetical protein
MPFDPVLTRRRSPNGNERTCMCSPYSSTYPSVLTLLTGPPLPNPINSDYRGLKKRITAIKDQIATRRQSRDGKNGRWNIKRVSLSAETTPGALGRDDKQRPPTLGTETSTRVETVTPVSRGPTFFRASRVMVIEKVSGAFPCSRGL